MTKRHLVIATRESPLALQQAESVKQLLLEKHPHLSIELLGLTTLADKRLDVSLIEIGGKGLFVKELEEALLDGRADIAVHCIKDVPMDLPPGLIIPTVLKREDPRDAFVSNDYNSVHQLPTASKIGTSSLRRQTQLRAIRSDLDLQMLRGNINTRLKRLDDGDFAGIILAAAGLKRMGLAGRIRSYFSVEECLPAAGQGALGIECREEDNQVRELIAPLHDAISFDCITAERAVCKYLEGGCKVPIAAFAQIHKDNLVLRGAVANRSATLILESKREGSREQAAELGIRVAKELLQQGAEKILREFK